MAPLRHTLRLSLRTGAIAGGDGMSGTSDIDPEDQPREHPREEPIRYRSELPTAPSRPPRPSRRLAGSGIKESGIFLCWSVRSRVSRIPMLMLSSSQAQRLVGDD